MTRKEEIQQAADNYIGHPYEIEEDLDVTTARNSFIQGAEWADTSFIEKACEWLKENYEDIGLGWIRGRKAIELIESFEKAMEE